MHTKAETLESPCGRRAAALTAAAAAITLIQPASAQDAEPATEADSRDTATASESTPPVEPDAAGANESIDVDELREPDSVPRLLFRGMETRDAIIERGPMDFIAPAWRDFNTSLEESIGLRLGLAHTSLYQSTIGAETHAHGAGGDLDFFGTWALLGDEAQGNEGRLVFSTEYRYQIGSDTPFGLNREFEGLGPTADGFGERPISLTQLFWEQKLAGERLVVSLGKVDAGAYYNTNRLSNVNRTFTHTAFATNIARGFPGEGIAAKLTVRPSDEWYALGGVHDANGSASTGDFRDIDNGEFAYISEFGLTPDIDGLGQGNYRVTAWYIDEREDKAIEDGVGFAISVDQEIGEHLVLFGRYGWSDGDATAADNTLAGGFGIEGIGDREDDFLGVAAGWLSPSVGGADAEFVTEIIYRLQLTRSQELSVGFQTIFNPSFSTDDETVGVFQARWRIAF